MKKILLIISGILILLLAIGIFSYLFLFGTPTGVNDMFANFGIGSGNSTAFEELPEENVFTDTQGPVIASDTLRQITTKPVAGMIFLNEATARYAEQGTGHIFDITLANGTETQVSNTTFVKVGDAHFSPNGTEVVLTYTEAGQVRNVVGFIQDGALTTTSLLSGARDFAWSDAGTVLYYIVETQNSTEAYAYDVEAKTSVRLYTVPFGSARALWGEHNYVYTKPAAALRGYVYEATGSGLAPITSGRFGLMATPFADGVAITETTNGTTRTTAFTDSGVYEVPLPLFPEKCTVPHTGEGDLICGGPIELLRAEYPDDWYKGVLTQNDLLWRIDVTAGEATLIVDPQTETGRIIDVARIVGATSTDQYLLIHKTNNTLWLLTP